MIKNDRQFKITRAQAESFRRSLRDLGDKARSATDPNEQLKWKIQESALRSQLSELETDIQEYESLQQNEADILEIASLEELPDVLIKARIATGLTHRQLAERLQLKEQQIQRYEATNYAGASLQRIQQVVDALGVKLRKGVFLPSLPITASALFSRLGELGFRKDFVEQKLISPKLRAALERNEAQAGLETLLLNSAARIARVFNWEPAQFFSRAPLTSDRQVMLQARFKIPGSVNQERLPAYTVYAHYLALLMLQATPQVVPRPIPASWRHVRAQLLKEFEEISLPNIVNYLWTLGVVVLPLKDSGHFHAATWRVRGRSVIVVKQQTQFESRWIVDLLHELWHAAQNQESPEHGVIEVEDREMTEGQLLEERIATDFAADIVFKGKADELAEQCAILCNKRMEWLKSAVRKVAAQNDVRVDLLANYMAYRLSLEGENWWGTASRLQTTGGEPWQQVRDIVISHINWSLLSASDRDLLLQALQN